MAIVAALLIVAVGLVALAGLLMLGLLVNVRQRVDRLEGEEARRKLDA